MIPSHGDFGRYRLALSTILYPSPQLRQVTLSALSKDLFVESCGKPRLLPAGLFKN
jgi:hypothetical protein